MATNNHEWTPGLLSLDSGRYRWRRAGFWLPEFSANSAWLGHLPFAEWLVRAVRPATIVELGVFSGASFLTFCRAAKELGIGTRCYGIDTWKGDDHTGTYSETVFEQLSKYIAGRHRSGVELMRTTFDDAVGRFDDRSVDVLHIDGLHYYETVRHDFETWRSKLSSRAIVLFHDTAVLEHGFGVHRLWSELSPHFPHFTFEHSYGLGVLGVGDDMPATLTELFAAAGSEEKSARVRSHFERQAYLTLMAAKPPLHVRIGHRLGYRSEAFRAWRRTWRARSQIAGTTSAPRR